MEKLSEDSVIWFSVILGNLYLGTWYIHRSLGNFMRLISIAVCIVATSYVSSQRGYQVRQLSWEFDGSVVRKYHSSNHGVLSLQIEGKNSGEYEGIEETFWNLVQVGDKISKVEYSPFSKINGEKQVFVQRNLIGTRKGRNLKE